MGWYYAIVGLVFQAALVVFAIRSHHLRRTVISQFMMWAVICYVIAASSWYTFNFAAGFFVKAAGRTPEARRAVADYRYYSDQTFQILFATFMIVALVSFARERPRSNTPTV
jgi:hypothetical protein